MGQFEVFEKFEYFKLHLINISSLYYNRIMALRPEELDSIINILTSKFDVYIKLIVGKIESQDTITRKFVARQFAKLEKSVKNGFVNSSSEFEALYLDAIEKIKELEQRIIRLENMSEEKNQTPPNLH